MFGRTLLFTLVILFVFDCEPRVETAEIIDYEAYCRERVDGAEKTISVEEMVVVTATGTEYLIAQQEELILIGGTR